MVSSVFTFILKFLQILFSWILGLTILSAYSVLGVWFLFWVYSKLLSAVPSGDNDSGIDKFFKNIVKVVITIAYGSLMWIMLPTFITIAKFITVWFVPD